MRYISPRKFQDLSRCTGKTIARATVVAREHRDPAYQLFIEFTDGELVEFYAGDNICVSGTKPGPATEWYSVDEDGVEEVYRTGE